MTHLGWIRILAISLVVLTMPPALHAIENESVDTDSKFYIRGKVSRNSVGNQNYNPLWFRGNFLGAPKERMPSLLSDRFTTTGIEMAVGKELDRGWFIETRGGFASLDHGVRTQLIPPGSGTYPHIGFFPIDGSSFGSHGMNFPYDVALDFAWRQGGLELIAGRTSDSSMGRITPFAGMWGMYLGQRYTFNADLPAAAEQFSIRDDVTTRYCGLLAGLRLNRLFGPVDLSLEASLGVGVAWSDYKSTQTFSRFPSLEVKVNQDKSAFACQGTLKAALDLSLGQSWCLGLSAGAQYLSYVPEVVSSGKSSNEPDNEAAHISGETSLNGTLAVHLTFKF